ncbi:MAG: pyridoxal-phosphate dependent enzyme [Phycisphaerales bacterium]|nr:MAG: pyridoxal-phosphate dependent enzyme [Phycisphaerales bacterium]
MKYCENVLELVGRTPLVKAGRMADPSMATILMKMDHLNPGGSVKDRIAVHIVRRAEERGLIKPGATLVESTSGNTGLGLAMTAAVLGYRCVFTIPDKMSKEKIDMLKAFGAEVVVTRTDLPHDHPESYVEIAKRITRETPNAFYADQYYNMDNPGAHYLTTGPEIWEDTDGKIDCLVAGIGTGGTVSGAAKYLKEKAAEAGRDVRVVCPDPVGSIYYDLFNKREPAPPRVYVVEGIGHDFMVGTLDFSVIDEVRQVSDRDSFRTARRLVREEGVFVGGSSGTAMFGALQVAEELGPGKTVVVILADTGDRYLTKCFDDDWMKDMGFLGLEERMGTVRELLRFKGGGVEFAGRDETVASVAKRMSTTGFSQLPVERRDGERLLMVHEMDVLRGLIDGACRPDDKAVSVATPLDGQVSLDDPLSVVQRILDDNNVAVAVDQGDIVGIISKIDMITFLTARG